MTATIDRLRGLHGPSTEAQAKSLPDIGEGLAAQLERLARDPTPWNCEVMAANLEGAKRAVMRLAEALKREADEPPAAA